MEEKKGYLILSTGDVLEGKWLGEEGHTEGEMVFNTAMTGYQEVMTDPSYAGQIVVMTYPLIGNYGLNDIDFEAIKPFLAGFIISSPCHTPEHYQSSFTIKDMITTYQIPTLYDIDTRALTRIIREQGEVYGKITSNPNDTTVQQSIDKEIVQKVSVSNVLHFYTKSKQTAQQNPHVVVMDYGYKNSIMQTLLELGCDVSVVPFQTTISQLQELNPDGVVLSNGPGNPEHLTYLKETIKQISDAFPTLGICLGHQLLALAHGAKTMRLPYGHRGSNHPVKDLITGKVFITSQNHGYVVDGESLDETIWQVTHLHVNDQSVEGMIHKVKPVMSVQFHPEAHPGPIDSHYIFQQFVQKLLKKGEKQHA
ncbi:carbamoyl phosphate synthase small subunit [Radiobacillus deserti]|uniref:Carbamoyl phosphate synthase small chain n=1 Tax=Radiobacillus deserti TaxID=2594883 RepID=A0A516KL00_9BACI|nr:carbamoyl phosphate synthase small subunit [Radiobacillus deserti]QDP42058.1 carbamoyl phosphate synthase small subunit [Radiobacillus deserti]